MFSVRYREGAVIQITCKAELNRLVANALHPEPPLSERRAIHESGCWRWNPGRLIKAWWGDPGRFSMAHWEPVDFCGDPVASKLLEDKICQLQWFPTMQRGHWHKQAEWMVEFIRFDLAGHPCTEMAYHSSRLVALCLAVLRAHNVEFELIENWDKK